MSYRNWDLKIQYETWKRLQLAIKLYPVVCSELPDFLLPQNQDISKIKSRILSVDELADRELNRIIREKFPKVLELEKKQAKVEAEAIKEAGTGQ